MAEPANLTLLQLRDVRERLSRMELGVADLKARVLALDKDMTGLHGHRVRHEEHFAEIGVMLERIARTQGILDG